MCRCAQGVTIQHLRFESLPRFRIRLTSRKNCVVWETLFILANSHTLRRVNRIPERLHPVGSFSMLPRYIRSAQLRQREVLCAGYEAIRYSDGLGWAKAQFVQDPFGFSLDPRFDSCVNDCCFHGSSVSQRQHIVNFFFAIFLRGLRDRCGEGSPVATNDLSADRYGLNILVFRSLIGLKCFALPVHKVNPCSAAVAATIASPALSPCESPYSSM